MDASPLVSIIVPFYNVADYAEETVRGLCDQSWKNLQIICIDDGSTDGTPDILQWLAGRDSRIQFISKENEGAGSTRNLGLDLAEGEFVSVLDSDDKYNPRMIEIAMTKAQITAADIVLYRSNQYLQGEDCYRETPWVVKLSQIPALEVFSLEEVKSNRFFAFQGWAWDKLFRRDFIETHRLRFQNTRIYNDMYFVFAACILARRIAYIDKVLIHQRKRGGGSLSDAPSPHWSSLFEALCAVEQVVKEVHGASDVADDFDAYVVHMVRRQLELCTSSDAQRMREAIRQTWYKEFPSLSTIVD